LRIVDQLSHKAMTATQIGEALDLPANKVHYHVRELERVGLVRLVETREKGGILEKYYRLVAADLQVPRALLQAVPPDESIAAAPAPKADDPSHRRPRSVTSPAPVALPSSPFATDEPSHRWPRAVTVQVDLGPDGAERTVPRRVIAAGALSFGRKELEEAAAS